MMHSDPSETSRLRRTAGVVFERQSREFGHIQLRRLRNPEDIAVVHGWVSAPYAEYWGMVGYSLAQVAEGYREIERNADVYLGYEGEKPIFLIECYDPARDQVGQHYDVEPGDRGMHVLLAPAEKPIKGFSWAVFSYVMDFLFSDPETSRVVVEPDIRNRRIHALNRRAGFRYQKVIQLGPKTAHLAFCTRADYQQALSRREGTGVAYPRAKTEPHGHLTPEAWTAANRALICKAISEFSHEALLQPTLVSQEGQWGVYVLENEKQSVSYRFRARILALDHWWIDRASLEKRAVDAQSELDAIAFFVEFNPQLGISSELLPVYLQEISATLYAAAYKHEREALSSADLVHAEFQEVETSMAEGHPCFVANSGRVGFDADDYVAFAPEGGADIHIVWLAAHRKHSQFSCGADLSYQRLLQEELGTEALAQFAERLTALGLTPDDYLYVPVHPWQWFNKLVFVFATDLAKRDLVCLGQSADRYRAQQSIRTLFNLSHPEKRYVKMALSVLNMGFMRGLSADYMEATPAINDWVLQLVESDPYFAEVGFGVLREVAAVGYRSPLLQAAVAKPSPYRKMLAALWRESPARELAPGRRLMTMAALLHRDRAGHALLPQLIKASGADVDTWLSRYLRCYLAPILHCMYRYELAFIPHGENIILVLEDNLPAKAILKDIAEEAVVMDPTIELPSAVSRLSAPVPEELKVLSIFTDVFDGVLRYVAQILLDEADYPEARFWGQVAHCMRTYQERHPALQGKFARYDVFAPSFQRSCLNRLQLRNNRQMIDLTDPAKNLQFAGTLENPAAG